VRLPPYIRDKIRDNTGNSVILAYIVEYNKLAVQNEDAIISSINQALMLVETNRIDEVLNKIGLSSVTQSFATNNTSNM
jgi:ABC-type uncharacterized transport system ATPase subunit